jgi:sugar lactone lactonase YvrE
MLIECMEDRLCPSLTLLVTDGFGGLSTNKILKFDGTDGHFISTFVPPNTFLNAPDLGTVLGPDGNIYKENFGANSVLRFDPVTGDPLPADGQTGANFVPPGSGGLSGTEGIDFGADGNLYVSSTNTNSVIAYNGSDGTLIGTFIASGSGGLTLSNDLHFGPDGHLYVDNFNASGKVLRFDENTGLPLPSGSRTGANFIDPGAGFLSTPNGFAWGPDGNLYVSNANANGFDPRILRFDGTTGDFIDEFVAADPSLGFIDAIAWGPDGNLYITNTIGGNGSILGYDSTGAPLGVFGDTGTSGLVTAAGLYFYDDGTGPGIPHSGFHHGQTNSLLVSASLVRDQGGIFAPVVNEVNPVEASLAIVGQQPPIENPALQGQSITLDHGRALPLQRPLQAAAHGKVLATQDANGALSPSNFDFVFGQE